MLSMYAVDSRYPGAHIVEDEVSPAIAYAQGIVSKVTAALRETDEPEETT